VSQKELEVNFKKIHYTEMIGNIWNAIKCQRPLSTFKLSNLQSLAKETFSAVCMTNSIIRRD
jgi:hypothetical protein